MIEISQPDSVFIRTTIDKLQQELEIRFGTREAMNSNILANAKVAIQILRDAEIVKIPIKKETTQESKARTIKHYRRVLPNYVVTAITYQRSNGLWIAWDSVEGIHNNNFPTEEDAKKSLEPESWHNPECEWEISPIDKLEVY